jgi:large subunit ribosomal protein L15
MARKDRKYQKKRGTRTCGHGHHNKNRGAGNKGGVGMAGGHKGKWTWVVKYDANRFGRRGFDLPSNVKNVYNSINVGMIDEFLPELISEGIAIKKGKGFEVDLTKTDYAKVLGSGRVTNMLSIKAIAFSSGATEKIESTGGKAIFALEETE